ncbi:MAG: phosphatidate cytidylyltransferase [Phycisphaeraceae bacterium]|nr:phosphatidate cytidylyltransferase [Phycisphaeraceae bacterium]
MLKHRLMMGPLLIALAIMGLWLDDRLTTLAAPAALRPFLQDGGNWPPGTVVFLVMLAVSFFSSREMARILRDKGIAGSKRIITTAAIAGLLVSCVVPSGTDGMTAVAIVSTTAVALLVLSVAFYSRHKSTQGVVAATGGVMLAFVYLGLMFGFLLAIRRQHSAWVLLWVVLTTKSSDIGAFAAGMTVGRNKLIPWLSPGKTWEGLAGGVLMAAGIGALGMWLLHTLAGVHVQSVWFGAIAGATFAVVGQAGDLIESMFKRDAGLKDSGGSIPGFGGVLDVIDSVLFVAPVAFWLLRGSTIAN